MPSDVTFNCDYRILAFLKTTFAGKLESMIDEIKATSFPISGTGQSNAYYGIAFGKYDLVVDLSVKSAKVSSFGLCELIKSLSKKYETETCGTLIMGKEMYAANILTDTIRSYTFLSIKPSEDNIIRIINILKRKSCSGFSLIWNNSVYEIILVGHGDIFEDLVDKVRDIRTQISDIVIDASTLITLKAKECDKEMVDEHIAISYIKLRKFEPEKLILPDSMHKITLFKEYQNPVERLGWFDVCLVIKFRTLKALHETLTNFWEKNYERILLSSTMFLHKRRLRK